MLLHKLGVALMIFLRFSNLESVLIFPFTRALTYIDIRPGPAYTGSSTSPQAAKRNAVDILLTTIMRIEQLGRRRTRSRVVKFA